MVSWESKSLPEFVRLTARLITGQYQELRSALLSTGKYRLAVTHKHLEVSKSTWMDMTDQQRKALYKCYRHNMVKEVKWLHRLTDKALLYLQVLTERNLDRER